MFKTVLASVAVTALSVPAFAGGLAPAPAPIQMTPVIPAPQPTADWSGFYVGLRAGIADFETELSPRYTIPTDGNFYGGFAGYRHDFGRVVVGGELRYSDISDISGPMLPPGFTNDSMTTAMLQVGYDLGRALPFIGVGAARLATTSPGGSVTGDGMVYGIGLDYRVSDRFTVGVDANRFDFEDFGSFGADITGTSVALRAAFNF